MHGLLANTTNALLAQNVILTTWSAVWPYLVIFAGFSVVIFVHELGHFLVAKWNDVRVERFAIGFFKEVVGFTRGETRYSFNILPLGGYVKMLGQEDFDDKTLEFKTKDNPRSFAAKTVFQRMTIVSAGVIMNLLFAAFLFIIVFMHGKEEYVTTIGQVLPESPAALAGLQPGDTVRKIDGRVIREYQEIKFAILLADPHQPLDFEVERDGEIHHLVVKPEPRHQKNLLQVGIMPATDREVVFPLDARFDRDDPKHLRAGDTVVAIEGTPIDQNPAGGIEQLMRSADGSPVNVTVERPEHPSDEDSPTTRLEAIVFNRMIVDPSDPIDDLDTRNILGLTSLVEVNNLESDGRAALAGLKKGDVILQWGPHKFPTQQQITKSVKNSAVYLDPDREVSWRRRLYDRFVWNPETDIPVVVARPGRRASVHLNVTPKVLKRGKPPRIGLTMSGIAGETLRVAGVQERVHGETTPAADADIPAGAMIQKVGGVEVSNWPQLVEQFRQNAGSVTTLTYQTPEGDPVTRDFRVPHCLRTRLGLTTLSEVVSVNGIRSAKIEGRTRTANVPASHSLGLYEILRRLMERNNDGPTAVTVRYREVPYGSELEKEVTLTADTIDPWLGRVRYAPDVIMQLQLQTLKATGPINALMIGVKKTAYFVLQVYTMLERMIFSRSIGVENMSGPVGIVKMGSDVVKFGGLNKFLFFLAMISANLAVINFLPLPIVDGGLMIFLIVEKIKGAPVSLKVQVATQVIGLFLIGAVFLFVTFQDVVRLAG
ncbi:MAG: RIP metalloprotease RseP [Phycisphaerae bacterium]